MSPATLCYLHEWTYQLPKICLLVWVCLKFCVQRTDMLYFSYANVVNCMSSAVAISVSSCHFLNLWKWGTTALKVQVSPKVKCLPPAMVPPQSAVVRCRGRCLIPFQATGPSRNGVKDASWDTQAMKYFPITKINDGGGATRLNCLPCSPPLRSSLNVRMDTRGQGSSRVVKVEEGLLFTNSQYFLKRALFNESHCFLSSW